MLSLSLVALAVVKGLHWTQKLAAVYVLKDRTWFVIQDKNTALIFFFDDDSDAVKTNVSVLSSNS